MTGNLTRWAITERDFLRGEIKWFRAGSKLLSPSGDDITVMKLAELEARLEHALLALGTDKD